MPRRFTIVDAAKVVLSDAGRAMTPQDILENIRSRELYDFRAKDPLGVLRSQMRPHAAAGRTSHSSGAVFELVGKDTYRLTTEV